MAPGASANVQASPFECAPSRLAGRDALLKCGVINPLRNGAGHAAFASPRRRMSAVMVPQAALSGAACCARAASDHAASATANTAAR
jgi:hypothetical protein